MVTNGGLLCGRVRYTQLADGYRTGLEPVLLAAAVPARTGERVLEAGCGAGAALLCLAARVPGVVGLGIDADASLTRLATANAAANGWETTLNFTTGRIEQRQAGEAFDHALANPPWHDVAGTPPTDARRIAAKRAGPGVLEGWIAALARSLRPRGTLTLIAATANLDAALAACAEHRLGSIRIVPLWPRAGREARMLLVQAVRHGRGTTRMLAGLVLHGETGFTPAARRIVEAGEALDEPDPRRSFRSARDGRAATISHGRPPGFRDCGDD